MMAEQILSLAFGDDTAEDGYWFKLEKKDDTPDDGMTIDEAANLIDAIYNIKPCEEQGTNDPWEQSDTGTDRDIWRDGPEPGQDEGADDAQRRFAEQIVNSGAWDINPAPDIPTLISYDVVIKVFRSHRDEPYTLQVISGKAGPAIKHSGKVVYTLDIDNKKSHTFDNPIIFRVGYPSPKMAWQGFDGPPITITGNTASWNTEVKGTLRAEFYTEWDEIKITVTGVDSDTSAILGTDQDNLGVGFFTGAESGENLDDFQSIECLVLGFYRLQYQQLQLDSPEADESTTDTDRNNITRVITEILDEEEPEEVAGDKCRQHINETVVCECEGKEELRSYYEIVPCPPGISNDSILEGSLERRTYEDCGHTDTANNPEFYEEKCCEPWPFFWKMMPKCKEVVVPYVGTDQEFFDRADWPAGTIFMPVGSADGRCGEQTIKQDIAAKNCCDGVPELVWDYNGSAEVVGQDSKCTVQVTGGTLPLTVSIRGYGFYLDKNLTIRDAIYETNVITIHTNGEACGSCQIYITDGCSSVGNAIRCTVGAWELIEGDETCRATGLGTYTYLGGWLHAWDIINGQYRTVLTIKEGDSGTGEDVINGIGEKDCDICPSAFQESEGLDWRGGTCGIDEPDFWPCEYIPALTRLVCSYIYSKVSYRWVCP